MVVEAEDPVTGTKWFDPSNLSGTAMTWVAALLGLTALFLAVGIVQNTLLPMFRSGANALPGVSAGQSDGITIETGGGA